MRFLTVAAVISLMAGPVLAQSQNVIPVYSGQVTFENSERFTIAVANRVDTIVGVKLTVDPTDNRSPQGYLVDRMSDDGGVYISRTHRNMGGVQINASSAYWRHGSYVIDGFFVVKYGGMGQGVMGYQLQPVDEAAVLLSSAQRITIDANDIPAEARAVSAD
tara:strand:- start:7441 stop:7926 length:486 start_codon:yes stop_codon:yes gene_type:complete